MVKRSAEPSKIFFKLLFTIPLLIGWFYLWPKISFDGPFLGFFAVLVFTLLVLTFTWAPQVIEWLASPISNMFDGGGEPPERKPFYSIAMTKRNRGKPREAIAEVRRQLDNFPNDFEGIMFMARIQAEDLTDLAEAEVTLTHFCDSHGSPVMQVAAAYTQLADWHLKLSKDADAARIWLQKIIIRFPDTEAALHAEQRIAHLVEAEKVLLAKQDRPKIEMQEGVKNVGLLDSTEFLKPKEVEPGQLAAVYVKHLELYPRDFEVREKLALIYGKEFKRLDLATMELDQLINEPKHKPKQIAHWLNMLANLQVELGAEMETVRATLGQIIERFPDLPIADLAQRRLGRLENEFKGMRGSASIKLGTYEQNIGLKYGGPRKPE